MKFNDYTIVTAFFDIGRDNWSHYTRSTDKYLQNGKRMLSLHDDMIIFIDPKFKDFVAECRKNINNKTTIIPINLTELYWYKYLDVIQNVMNNPEFKNNLINPKCPEVSNPLYDIIMFSKTMFISLAIQNNLSNKNHYVWLDFGVHDHMLKDNMLNDKLLKSGVNDKLKFLCREYPKQSDLNLHTFFKSNTNRFAGTMFTGHKDYLLKFNEILHDDIISALNNNVIDCDQNFFSNVYIKHPDMFELYFGDWSELVSNYYKLNDNRFYIEYMSKTTNNELGKNLINDFLQTSVISLPVNYSNDNSNTLIQNNIKYTIDNNICTLSDICKVEYNNNFNTIFFNNLKLNNKYIIENIKLNIEILKHINNIAITENNVDKYIQSLLVSLGFTNLETKNSFVLFSKTKLQSNEISKPVSSETPKELSIKLMCNWLSNTDIIKLWEKFNYKDSNIKLVSDNKCDYYVIINKPQPNDYFEPNKTLVFRMEPDTETNSHWDDWFVNKNSFKWFGDLSKYMNNNEWHLSLNYETLLNSLNNRPNIFTNKTKILSAVVSNLMSSNGHIFRINLLQNLQKILLQNNFNILDIYGRNSQSLFTNHCGELPYHNKDNGLIPYRYHIAIENTNLNNYFTEKLIDGILSECCVFYWGCNNITEYFDSNSFIQLPYYPNDLQKTIIDSINLIILSINNDEYTKRLPYILSAKSKILKEYSFINRLKKLI